MDTKNTLFLTVFCSIFSLQSPFTHIFPWVDSSAFLYDGLSLTKGLVMYKDFFDHKGPLIFIINYLGINLTGGILGVWVLEVLSLFIFFIFLYKLIKLFSNNFTYILTSLIIMLTLPYFTGVGNFTELFSLPFIMIGLYFLTKYFFKKELSKKL